jgi:glycyl-tRNA synthetase beta chain
MSQHADFLVEIGTAELPAVSLMKLSTAFREGLRQRLVAAEMAFAEITAYATPRRLALVVHDLVSTQPERLIERRGPAISAAYHANGAPTGAALGFAKSCGVNLSDLSQLETPQGSWLVYKQQVPGKTVAELLPEMIASSLQALPIPKPMYWGNCDFNFIRPVYSVVMLFGEQVVPGSLFGRQSDRFCSGHRFHHPEPIALSKASEYEPRLAAGHVIANFNTRLERIRESIHALAKAQGATPIFTESLLAEIAGLVEWPVALLANFKPDYLQVPKEAIIASLQTHQRCIALEDANGKLLPLFIAISNIESTDPAAVIRGNERVIDARLSDAMFFYQTDLQDGFANKIAALSQLTFQSQLGSVGDKSQRVAQLAAFIATTLGANPELARRAALLAKCDLLSHMVGEFPELQGIMGADYARHEQEPEAVITAIRDHYLPRFSGDKLPADPISAAVAIADRLDTLVGIFGINQQPTGDKDPFGLRRAALGVVRIIIENNYSLDLVSLLNQTILAYTNTLPNTEVTTQVHHYLIERMRAWYTEQAITQDVFDAVLDRQKSDLYDFHARVLAVQGFTADDAAVALAAANKRVRNLLQKEQQNINTLRWDTTIATEPAEQALALFIAEKQQALAQKGKNYQAILAELAQLRPAVDRFFDEVMVMVDDEKVRNNRLALLAQLRHLFLMVADISLLSAA